MVGLRPYRPAGFVVASQPLDEKTVIHNYGHGGAGITLSWGTSQLAVELAWQGECRDFAVLGCGAVGLATARLLQQRGGQVTIYARDLPPHTTSNVAGGQWGAASVADSARRTPAWDQQLERASALAHRAFQDLLGDQYGVRWLEHYDLTTQPPGQRKSIDNAVLEPKDSPFPGYYARRFSTMMIEPAHYLHQMMQDVLMFGGKIEVHNLQNLEAIQQLPQAVVFNCTGLGSRELFGDEELIPVKGQLSVLLPQPEVDYAVVSGGLYMFPRRDGILLGGTHQRGNWSLEPDPVAEQKILAEHTRLFASLV